MHASGLLISLLSLCLMALVLSPASAAETPRPPSPAAGAIDEWLDDLPAEIVSALQMAAPGAGGTEDDAAAGGIIAVPPARRQGFRPARHPSALSPEAMRKLEHEARCGPRVPVRRGSVPWPEWKPRCRGGDDDVVADGSATRLPPDVDEP